MSELSELKKQLKELQQQKEVAKVQKQINEIKNPSKVKATGNAVKKFFKPRGNEKEKLDFLMGL